MHLNLHLLRVFMHVAELGSFSRAAERLAITQPAVSKAVTELEHQLDLALLERTRSSLRGRRQWQLTEHGQALLEHARGIFALERAALDDLQARLDCQRGHLHLGASSTIAGYWLTDVMTTFCATYPDAQLSLASANTEEICQALLDCRLDLALVEGQVNDPRIATRHWCDEPLKLVCPADWQVNEDSLNQHRWLWREPGSGTRSWMERHLQDAGIIPKASLEIGNNEGIARAVAAGLGLSILPLKVCEELLTLGRLQVLDMSWSRNLHRPLFLLQLKQRPLSPLAAQFRQLLVP
ncbi:LysR family transcriptional regulator [Bowmanella pacifica]|uniref:LysR family transcriptional regulator n=1 Tax=Bowmanella pacifica TaxID=502051 RepID=A0A918DI60_9ALTE|nr:LysR family transcriptional regulator [Bowmanella pacifica]GGO65454.1 LysR family transcriptional regulator [Bowmanella pacifica]